MKLYEICIKLYENDARSRLLTLCRIAKRTVVDVFQVGARLIAHAGSLTNLAKYPASTVQILGAEKALFR